MQNEPSGTAPRSNRNGLLSTPAGADGSDDRDTAADAAAAASTSSEASSTGAKAPPTARGAAASARLCKRRFFRWMRSSPSVPPKLILAYISPSGQASRRWPSRPFKWAKLLEPSTLHRTPLGTKVRSWSMEPCCSEVTECGTAEPPKPLPAAADPSGGKSSKWPSSSRPQALTSRRRPTTLASHCKAAGPLRCSGKCAAGACPSNSAGVRTGSFSSASSSEGARASEGQPPAPFSSALRAYSRFFRAI
mmetsp:Transcript_6250/g.14244  ORF Transcript_6250/g.14244 Transcript_6250/m.14244 type:complete len:249 (-) Transcript_6250:464-1210(-)